MKTCTNCNGSGLAGQGESPWLHQGHLTTCGSCSGTGKVPEADAAAVDAPSQDASALSTGTDAAPEKRGGILGMIDAVKEAL